MDQNSVLLLYAVLFVGILLAVEGFSQLIGDLRYGPERAINRRLRMLASGVDPEEVVRILRRPSEATGLARFAALQRLATLAVQSGSRLPVGGVLAVMALMAIVAAVLLRPVLGLPTAVAAGARRRLRPAARYLRLKRAAVPGPSSRSFPTRIDLVVRSLRAGQPLNAALRIVARETLDPLGSEIGLLVDEVTYGKSLPDAAHAMADRIGLDEVHYMVVAIKIQHGSGGNLAEILAALSRVLRERATMQRKIYALSAEGRLSAIVLSAFPIFLGGAIQLTSPTYFGDVAQDPLFQPLVIFVLVMMALNIAVTRRIVNFDY